MKKISFLIISSVLFGLISCGEEKFYLWDDPETHLAFKFEKNDLVSSYSFVYENEEVDRDTVFFNVYTSGFVRNEDFVFEFEQLEQLDTLNLKAIEGVHFVKFDDPEVRKYFVVRAGTVKATVPIILLRDKSLTESQFELRVKIKENKNFTYGVVRDLEKRLVFSDILQAPKMWTPTSFFTTSYFGPYSIEKHRFMIDVTPGGIVDDDFLATLYGGSGSDMNLMKHYQGLYKSELILENARRKENNLDVLREKPKKGQTIGDAIFFK